MTVTRDAVEKFLIATITDPNGIPTTALNALAAENGITPDDIKTHSGRLRLTQRWGAQHHTGLHTEACIACLTITPYAEPVHRFALCADCPTPVTSWRWERPDPARPRRKHKILVGHWPAGWPHHPGQHRNKTCSSTLARARDRAPWCTNPVVWKVTDSVGSSRYTAYWCDTDLPDRDRPHIPALAQENR